MKNSTIFQAILSIMILFSIATATAQNFQHSKKKYSIVKKNNHSVNKSLITQDTSQVSMHHYTDAELIELANYIKKLEKQNTLTGELIAAQEIAATETAMPVKNTPDNYYTDDELVKIANYIKFLELTDWTGTVAVIK